MKNKHIQNSIEVLFSFYFSTFHSGSKKTINPPARQLFQPSKRKPSMDSLTSALLDTIEGSSL